MNGYKKSSKDEKMDKVQQYNALCGKLYNLYLKKNSDYGDSFSKTFNEFGLLSAIIRISDKYNRLVSLYKKGKIEVKDESIEDTLIDMAGYCLMTVLELKAERGNKNG